MANVQELTKALEEAKKIESEEKLQRQLAVAKEEWENSCFSTHLLHRKIPRGRTIQVRRVNNIFLNNAQVFYEVENIEIRNVEGSYSFFISTYNCDNPYPGYYAFKHKLEPCIFEKIKQICSAKIELVISEISEYLNVPDDYISQGDYNKEISKTNLLKESGIEYIDMSTLPKKWTDYPSIEDMLNWNNHPLLIGRVFVKNSYSKSILEKIIQKIEESAVAWGGSIYERDAPRIRKLREFLHTI